MIVDLGEGRFAQGGYLAVKRALRDHGSVEVRGHDPELRVNLPAWARGHGHACVAGENGFVVTHGAADRRVGAERIPMEVVARPSPRWGFAARGALVEAGAPPLEDTITAWSEDAGRLYLQAAATQWDPATAVDWGAHVALPEEIEDAVVQVMTYLIENETVALIVPARFLGRVHPHFREVMQVLAIQVADEARHIEVFTRRAQRVRPFLGLSTAGGQASLHTLLEEPDFALASFLLSVLGEGSFLSLLRFLGDHGPDPITRQVCRLSGVDEARHVAFGLSHLVRHVRLEPSLRGSLRTAIERRHGQLQHTAGLNEEVFDALVLMAAGSYTPADLDRGWRAVVAMKEEMDHGRRVRLGALGFSPDEAEALSGLHTRNFM